MLRPRLWAEMTAPEIGEAQRAGAVVAIPVGAVEQHGPHLPVDTDISLAVATLRAAASDRSHVIVAPPVWWGLSGSHTAFPGYFTLRATTFLSLLEDLCNSLIDQGFARIALIVGHASNKAPAGIVISNVMQQRGVSMVQLNYINLGAPTFAKLRRSRPGGEFHAGELETALMLHVRPDLVKMDRARAQYLNPARDFGLSAAPNDIFGDGEAVVGIDIAAHFPDGVVGDATLATAEAGRAVFEAIVARIGEILDEYHEARDTGGGVHAAGG